MRATSNQFDKRGYKELPTLTFSAYFLFFDFFGYFSSPSFISEHMKYIKNHKLQKNIPSYNTVFETTSNHSFQVPNRSYKVKRTK